MSAAGVETKHIVQFSTGLGSAEAARRVIAEHGVENVVLLTADTLVEDDDNWRFGHEAHAFLGSPEWTILADGRTPMQVGRDMRVVPNNRMAVCSRVLKRELLRKHLDDTYDPAETVIHLGFDWTEPERWNAARRHWERAGWKVSAVLTEPPYAHKPMLVDQWRGYGIEPPRLYAQGFGHANCGGACVRGGQAPWRLLLTVNRPRYLEWEAEEEETRSMLNKNVSILRDRRTGRTVPLTLRTFRERLDLDDTLFDAADAGACGCDMPDEDGAA